MASEEQIKRTAYIIWEREGRPKGKDQEHWFRAEKIIELHEVLRNVVVKLEKTSQSNEVVTAGSEESKVPAFVLAIILAAIPAIGYGLVFVYESGFCSVFGIPEEFIVIDWTTILIAIGSFIGFSIVLFSVFQTPFLMRILGISIRGPIKRRIIIYSIVLLVCLLIYTRYNTFIPQIEFVLFLPVYFIIIGFLGPRLAQRNIHGYRNQLEAQDKIDSQLPKGLPIFVQKQFTTILTIMMAISILFLCANFEGIRNAKTQEIFLVPYSNTQITAPSSSPQSIVLKVYGDLAICAPFDPNTKRTGNAFWFLKLGDNPNLVLIPQKLGPGLNTK